MSHPAVVYEIEQFYPGFDLQSFWDLFVDHESWSRSDALPGEITIVEPGDGHPQGLGAVRSVASGPMTILEDIVAFEPPTQFRYASRNGSMPVDDFTGELFLEQREDGVHASYRGSFNPKAPGTGPQFAQVFRAAQESAFVGLGQAYQDRYGV